jgi:hypothetical protein
MAPSQIATGIDLQAAMYLLTMYDAGEAVSCNTSRGLVALLAPNNAQYQLLLQEVIKFVNLM